MIGSTDSFGILSAFSLFFIAVLIVVTGSSHGRNSTQY